MQFNNVPPGVDWRRLIECETDKRSKDQRLFCTISCMHCNRPFCLEACPTGATFQRTDGIVDINYDLCVGCGSCVLACPYKARTINISADHLFLEQGATKGGTKPANQDRIGLCTKCNFCSQLVDDGLRQGLTPGQDPEATPICVRYCIAEALHFGDLDDPESEVSRLIRDNKALRLHEELGTEPSVYYIPKS